MSFAFFAAAQFLTLAALALVVRPLFRERSRSQQRLDESRLELRLLIEANSAGTLDSARYAAKRASLGEALLEHIGDEPSHAAPTMYVALAIAILVPLAAFGSYRWIGAVPDLQAQGSKAHYPEARYAFKLAVEAAPEEAGLEREYAAAEIPNHDGPPEPDEAQFPQCDVPAFSAAGGTASMASECTETSAPRNGAARITVSVSLAPELKSKVLPGDTLLVFAKAAQGAAMPLAIARLTAAQLPANVTLTDAMYMMPNQTLSKFPQVVLGARISKSGNPIAQSNDFQILSAAVSNSGAQAIPLTIDRMVE